MNQYSMAVTVIVKAVDREDAEGIVTERMNGWFLEDGPIDEKEGFSRGSLLLWRISGTKVASPTE